MLSKHTTPEIDLLRFFDQYHNDSLPPLCLRDNIWGSGLWRHTCIAYSFVFLVFGAQICCQLIILLCIFPERNKQRLLLANWGRMPNNQQTYLHVMCVITVLSMFAHHNNTHVYGLCWRLQCRILISLGEL